MPAFNDTVPTIHGNASNHIESYVNSEGKIDPELTRSWYSDSPLASVVEGCVGESSTSCRATIYAPALFPTCITRSQSIDTTESWDWKAAYEYKIAPPPYALGFAISIQLVTSGAHELINLVVASADMRSCSNGTLHYTICELRSGIGAYGVDIIDNNIQMKSLPTPRFEALSNNTHVNSTFADLTLRLHSSTLGGLVYMSWQKWVSTLFRYFEDRQVQFIYESTSLPYSLAIKPDTFNAECVSFLNLTDDVLSSLNNLAVRLGAHAAKHPGPPDKMRMDPGLSLHTKASGHVVGQEDKYHTNYRFFAAAALVEILCIALILPT